MMIMNTKQNTPLPSISAKSQNDSISDRPEVSLFSERALRQHLGLLGHSGLGVTELRTFDGMPMVAYSDNEDEAVRLCLQMERRKKSGIYVGVQPRPFHFFEHAPNDWQIARGNPSPNCASDQDIEYITTCFFDIDVVSHDRQQGFSASRDELKDTFQAARLLSRQEGLAQSSTICGSGNGHYVLAPMLPIEAMCREIADQFRSFCQYQVGQIKSQVKGVKLDPVYNLSRVMRLMGTMNRKGQKTNQRPHRLAQFVTEPLLTRSFALQQMIMNTEVAQVSLISADLTPGIKGNLEKLEKCSFIRWCRAYPEKVSEPQWFGLVTNLARLAGGVELIREISRLDSSRYDEQQTQKLIERVLKQGYKPIHCDLLMNQAPKSNGYGCFCCIEMGSCPARAPMYLAASHTVYHR